MEQIYAGQVSLVIYLHDLSGGGAERANLRLAAEFIKLGWKVTFLIDRAIGELASHIPPTCPIKVLECEHFRALPRIIRFLRQTQPDVLIANSEDTNVVAILAGRLARTSTRIVVAQRCTLSQQVKRLAWKYRLFSPIYGMTLPFADAIIAVSAGVADDLAAYTGVAREDITVIRNGVVTADFEALASSGSPHRWFDERPPVILGMGRLVPQKDFKSLIVALGFIKDLTDARLLILGEGPLRGELERFAQSLGLADRVALPGFVDNPLPFLRRASLFVLASRFEGYPNAMAEALACGTPVVSTDCPHGPREILDAGRFGRLVPVADSAALGRAILSSLSAPPDRGSLKAHGRTFTVESCAAAYRHLISGLLEPAVTH